MNEFTLRDDIQVECETCGADIPAKVSVLENDNSLVCPKCGAPRIINVEELHRQLEEMRKTLEELQSGGIDPSGGGTGGNKTD